VRIIHCGSTCRDLRVSVAAYYAWLGRRDRVDEKGASSQGSKPNSMSDIPTRSRRHEAWLSITSTATTTGSDDTRDHRPEVRATAQERRNRPWKCRLSGNRGNPQSRSPTVHTISWKSPKRLSHIPTATTAIYKLKAKKRDFFVYVYLNVPSNS